MRFAKKVDQNQAEIVLALRKIGIRVYVSSGAGSGLPDLVCFHQGRIHALEIKAKGKRKRLTPAQVDFHSLASSGGYLIPVVETVEEAIEAVTKPAHTRPAIHHQEQPCISPMC